MSGFEPSDWKNTQIPKLSQLDSLQRCLICKDFLKAPVITSCNHTFCSQCIRQHLMSESSCPLCKVEQLETNLKRVILLEEIVLCYQALREDLISLVKARSDPSSKTASSGSTPSKFVKSDSVEIIEILDDAGDQSSSSSPTDQVKEVGYVACPVCTVVMKEEHVQGSHLDYCLNGKTDPKLASKTPPVKKRPNDVLSFFQGQKRQKQAATSVDHEKFYFEQGNKHHHDTKRLPKIDFGSLTTAKVREKLGAYRLSTQGSRADLVGRYNQYYLLHQSNLDSNHPVPDIELRQKLKQWEVSHQSGPVIIASNTIYGDDLSRKSISDKDFPIKAWLEHYKDEFKELVKQARKSRKLGKSGNLHKVGKDSTPVGEAASHQPTPKTTSTSESLNGHMEDQSGHDTGNDIPEPSNPKNSDSNIEDEKTEPVDDFDFSNSTLFGVE